MAVYKPVEVEEMTIAAELAEAADEQELHPITEEDIRKIVESCPGRMTR